MLVIENSSFWFNTLYLDKLNIFLEILDCRVFLLNPKKIFSDFRLLSNVLKNNFLKKKFPLLVFLDLFILKTFFFFITIDSLFEIKIFLLFFFLKKRFFLKLILKIMFKLKLKLFWNLEKNLKSNIIK